MAKNIKSESTDNNNKASSNQYFNLDTEKAFFDEVDEEVRNERFKELMNKYGVYILAFLILALSLTVGYEKIALWRQHKSEQANIQYVKALAKTDDYNNNIAELENIVATENGLYKDIAYLQIANILLDNNETDKALEVLNKIVKDDTTSAKIKEIAAIKIATYKVDTATFEEINSLLAPIVAKNGAWSLVAKELLAMSAIHNNDIEKAKSIYQELLINGNISVDLKTRINDMLAFLNEEN